MIFLQFSVAGASLLLLVRDEIISSSRGLIPVPCTLFCAGPENAKKLLRNWTLNKIIEKLKLEGTHGGP